MGDVSFELIKQHRPFTVPLSLVLKLAAMSQSPPLTGLRVLEFAGLAPGRTLDIRPYNHTC